MIGGNHRRMKRVIPIAGSDRPDGGEVSIERTPPRCTVTNETEGIPEGDTTLVEEELYFTPEAVRIEDSPPVYRLRKEKEEKLNRKKM